MKKNNKKGFVLAESIVVGVFLMGLLSILILNILPLIGDYERISKYDNLDRKYDINLIRKMILMDENDSGAVLSNVNISSSNSLGFIKYTINDSTNNIDSFCNTLLEKHRTYCAILLGRYYLNVKTLIISTYNIEKLKSSIGYLNLSRGLTEYIRYLPSDNMISTVNTTANTNTIIFNKNKKLIVEFSDNTYASIEVPYE